MHPPRHSTFVQLVALLHVQLDAKGMQLFIIVTRGGTSEKNTNLLRTIKARVRVVVRANTLDYFQRCMDIV